MHIYTFWDGENERLYSAFRKAMDDANATLENPAFGHLTQIEINRCEVVKLTRAAVIAILEDKSAWVKTSEIAATVRRK